MLDKKSYYYELASVKRSVRIQMRACRSYAIFNMHFAYLGTRATNHLADVLLHFHFLRASSLFIPACFTVIFPHKVNVTCLHDP